MEIKYVKEDATSPIIVDGKKSVIVHCVNTLGAWGAVFVVPLGKKYPQAKRIYKLYVKKYKEGKCDELLGRYCGVSISENLDVIDLFGQERIYPTRINGELTIPLVYDALRKGFKEIINDYTLTSLSPQPITIHMPRIGCGLAGGDWNKVEKIINETFIKDGIEVYVYDLK